MRGFRRRSSPTATSAPGPLSGIISKLFTILNDVLASLRLFKQRLVQSNAINLARETISKRGGGSK